jgi:thiamine-phosphate pyrophosphorylase
MCLTDSSVGTPHSEQAARLCAAGGRWVQLRIKDLPYADWLKEASGSAEECRRHGALLTVNDCVEVALESGADGVHLGRLDGDWRQARRRIGSHRILGGTVNSLAEAARAVEAGCLDYAGVGPLRFTSTKRNLSGIQGLEGVRALIRALETLPAWVIGGVGPDDLPALREAGASGVAVFGCLYAGGDVDAALRRLHDAWAGAREPARLP